VQLEVGNGVGMGMGMGLVMWDKWRSCLSGHHCHRACTACDDRPLKPTTAWVHPPTHLLTRQFPTCLPLFVLPFASQVVMPLPRGQCLSQQRAKMRLRVGTHTCLSPGCPAAPRPAVLQLTPS